MFRIGEDFHAFCMHVCSRRSTSSDTFVVRRSEFVTLYNFKTGMDFQHTIVHRGPLVGRLKILRGDLVVTYSPSRSGVHIVNYKTGAVGWLGSEKRLRGTSVSYTRDSSPYMIPDSGTSLTSLFGNRGPLVMPSRSCMIAWWWSSCGVSIFLIFLRPLQ